MACIRRSFKRDKQNGQSLVEYGLCLALVAVVCITALNALGANASAKLLCIALAVGVGSGGAGGGGAVC